MGSEGKPDFLQGRRLKTNSAEIPGTPTTEFSFPGSDGRNITVKLFPGLKGETDDPFVATYTETGEPAKLSQHQREEMYGRFGLPPDAKLARGLDKHRFIRKVR